MQRCGNGEPWDRTVELVSIVAFTQQTAFQYGFRQLFDEKRNAVRAPDDLSKDRVGEGLARYGLCQRFALALAETAKRNAGDVLMVGPGRAEFGPCRCQQQQALAKGRIDGTREELKRCGIKPMHVLEYDQCRFVGGEFTPQLKQSMQDPLLDPLRRQARQRIAIMRGDGQERGEGRQVGRGALAAAGQQPVELIELFLRPLLALDAGCAPKLRNDGPQRAIAVMR